MKKMANYCRLGSQQYTVEFISRYTHVKKGLTVYMSRPDALMHPVATFFISTIFVSVFIHVYHPQQIYCHLL